MINTQSLLWKLTLAFVIVAIAATGLMALFVRVTSVDRLSRLIIDRQRSNLQVALEQYYRQTGSWDGVEQRWGQFMTASGQGYNTDQGEQPASQPFSTPVTGQPGQFPFARLRPGERERRLPFGLIDASGVVLVSVSPAAPVGSVAPAKVIRGGEPLRVDGKRVGTIITVQTTPSFSAEENLYMRRTDIALALAAAGTMLVALALGAFLARRLILPVQDLTGAAQRIARGQLDQQVKVTSTDEIGQLAEAFNQMSAEVSRVNLQRKQMTADIAHDLRTPLTVIAGYVEAMRDGVLKPTPERLDLIYTEIERLQNLVGDLRMLSQVDAGELPLNPQPVAPQALLEQAAAPYQMRAAQQGVTLAVDAPGVALPPVRVDAARMMQVFGNLLSNALRYTPSGGQIRLSARAEAGQVLLSVADTGEGIAPEELPFIFDRFHRADKSRSAETGQSGLGLAIVRALVEAHGGAVRASSTPGQGTTITITLPAAAL